MVTIHNSINGNQIWDGNRMDLNGFVLSIIICNSNKMDYVLSVPGENGNRIDLSYFQENNKYAKSGQVHPNIDTMYFQNFAGIIFNKKCSFF